MTDTVVKMQISGNLVGVLGPASYSGSIDVNYTAFAAQNFADSTGTLVSGAVNVSSPLGDVSYSNFYITRINSEPLFEITTYPPNQSNTDLNYFILDYVGELPAQSFFEGTDVVTPLSNSGWSGSGDTITSTVISGSVPCFVVGTKICTSRGAINVETLQIGDAVVTSSGRLRAIEWIGHRLINIRRHPMPRNVLPVRVCAGAFGEGVPIRDLCLSPGHNVVSDGVLMPISSLINGRSVAQIEVDEVEYSHVELDAHDVMLAEGLPAESYLDTGNRTSFPNGGAFVEAHPDFQPKHWAQTCLPLVLEGPAVVATKARLLARLAELGEGWTQDADCHVMVDGLRVEPIRLSETRFAFALPPGGRELMLRSQTFIPAQTVAESNDPRTLGLCIGALDIDGTAVALDQPEANSPGWQKAEFADGRFSHRWTTGATPLPNGARIVILEFAGAGCYWSASEGLVAARA